VQDPASVKSGDEARGGADSTIEVENLHKSFGSLEVSAAG